MTVFGTILVEALIKAHAEARPDHLTGGIQRTSINKGILFVARGMAERDLLSHEDVETLTAKVRALTNPNRMV